MIFETHAHYEDKQFDEDREQLLASLKDSGIATVVNVSSSLETMEKTKELMETYPFIYGSAGVHPEEAAELTDDNFYKIEEMAKNPKVVAIGEIGLDYYWKEPEHDLQKKWFALQLNLAQKLNLPIIVHSRDAAKDTIDMIKKEYVNSAGGVIHCFSYGIEVAREFLDLGFYLGIGGVVTFPNAKKVREVVRTMPLNRLVLETDSPYLAPVPNRGKRNTSLNLIHIVKEIAEIRNMDPDELINVTEENAKNLYSLNFSR